MSKKRSRKMQTKAASSKSFEFNPDYTYIKQDLKRIGVLAASFVVIMIALSFVIK